MSELLSLVSFVVLLVVAVAAFRRRGRPRAPGSAAAGAVYDFLNEDKRAALEIVLEQRAAYHDPEDRDGNLPDLAGLGYSSQPDVPAHSGQPNVDASTQSVADPHTRPDH